jgi:hypothetical protein
VTDLTHAAAKSPAARVRGSVLSLLGSTVHRRDVMHLQPECSDREFDAWLAGDRSEDELREAYVALEALRRQLWTTGHIDSFRRDRYERDAVCISRLVRIKRSLASQWAATGQLDTPTPGDRLSSV